MKVLDLFSGIGGFSLGLERAGMRTVAFCEIEPYCRAVLRKHWPDVPCHDDVRTLDGGQYRGVDVVCGGFPCQDISAAAGGKAKGLDGERSGLWFEMARIVAEARPRWVIVENSPRLRTLGIDRILADLDRAGYTGRPLVVGAVHAGAPHYRKRCWIVANRQNDGCGSGRAGRPDPGGAGQREPERTFQVGVPDRARHGRAEQAQGGAERQRAGQGGQSIDAADGDGAAWRPEARTPVTGASREALQPRQEEPGRRPAAATDRHGSRLEIGIERPQAERAPAVGRNWWQPEPNLGRVVHGVPSRVDRLRALGNAVVPQIPEIIGRAIMEIEHAQAP